MRPSTLLTILILLIANSASNSSGAPLRESSINSLLDDYVEVMNTDDCTEIRRYAARANNAVIDAIGQYYVNQDACKKMNSNSSMFDEVKRVYCLVNFYLTYNDRLTLLMMATLYAVFLVTVILTAFLFISAICYLIQYLMSPPESVTPTTTRVKISKSSHKTYYPKQNTDIEKILLPDSYRHV